MSGSERRTFNVTIRAEVETGRLGEWLSANIPPGSFVRIEETNLEGTK